RVGSQLGLFTTGSGLTLVAFQAPERIAETLRQWGVASSAPLAGIGDQIETIRKQGYRIGASGQLIGVTDISVPIFGPDGDAAAVLTCAFIEHVEHTETQTQAGVLARLLALRDTISLN